MDTPLAFKIRFRGFGWVVFATITYKCNSHIHLWKVQTLKQAAFPWCSSPVPGGQLGFSGMDALRKQLAKPKCYEKASYQNHTIYHQATGTPSPLAQPRAEISTAAQQQQPKKFKCVKRQTYITKPIIPLKKFLVPGHLSQASLCSQLCGAAEYPEGPRLLLGVTAV